MITQFDKPKPGVPEKTTVPDISPPAKIIPMVPVGKVLCFVTGKLRQDTPEENARQRWARSLVGEYKYRLEDLGVEVPIKMGRARKRADIVVYRNAAPHKQENIIIIVEVKRSDVGPTDSREGAEQLKSYMAACSSCRYGLWVGKERRAFERLSGGEIEEGLADIPSLGETESQLLTFVDLAPALDLTAVFKRCHNYIYVNQGIQKAEAFHEMLKLIFSKVYDETESVGALQFYTTNDERRSEAGQQRLSQDRIKPLFEAVRTRYPYIFKDGEAVELNQRVLAYIVAELQRISLLKTHTDIKGAAYEELVGANLRGARGEFFTPRNVCDMAVKIIMATYQPSQLTSLQVLDPCCGTGGFLVSYVNHVRDLLMEHEEQKAGTANVEHTVAARVKDLCTRNLFGIDINPFLVRTCQMNLVMHGDGSANIFRADTTLSPGEWDDRDAARKVPYGKADIVVTNPPFGGEAVIDDPHVLSKYELASYGASSIRTSMPAEQLFIEAALRMVKPGGRLGIVLPDSILNNPGLRFIREWLMLHARPIASVDLPKETFATSGGVPNPSLLVVQRLDETEEHIVKSGAMDDYEVFMALPTTAGIDKRGNPTYLRSPEGFEVLAEGSLEPEKDDQIGLVADAFKRWYSQW